MVPCARAETGDAQHTCGSPWENRVVFFFLRPQNRPSADPPRLLAIGNHTFRATTPAVVLIPVFARFFSIESLSTRLPSKFHEI